MREMIITCALAGSIHTPSMSPHLPITDDEIAQAGIEAAEAGAAILHLHARDPQTGRPSADPEHFCAFLPRLKQGCDAVLNLSTGGSVTMTLDERLAAPQEAAPEMASLNMGTMNFALYPITERFTDWYYEWERPFLDGSGDLVFKNTLRDIARILSEVGRDRGARFEFECYDLSHLYMLKHFADRGLIQAPYFIKFVFGVLGGHVRVGLEDSLTIGRGTLVRSNAAQVIKARGIIEALSRVVASPDEARAMMGFKSADRVAI